MPRQRTEPPLCMPLHDAGATRGRRPTKVREVLTTLYHDRPDGLSGNGTWGADVSLVRPLVAGHVEAEACGRKILVQSPLFGQAEVRSRAVCSDTAENNNSAANKYNKACLAQPSLHSWIGRRAHDEGQGAAFEMGAEGTVRTDRRRTPPAATVEEQRLFKSGSIERDRPACAVF